MRLSQQLYLLYLSAAGQFLRLCQTTMMELFSLSDATGMLGNVRNTSLRWKAKE